MKIKKYFIYFMLAISLLYISACSKNIDKSNKISASYNYDQILLFVLSQKDRLESIYGKEIFSLKFYDNTMAREGNYKEIFLEDMRHFIIELEVLNKIADNENIELSEEEIKKLEGIARNYYKELETDSNFKDIKEDDIKKIFVDYYRANKFKDSLLSTTDLEVSESEARVIYVNSMEFSDEETADKALKALESEGFNEVSKKYAKNVNLNKKLTHKDLSEDADIQVFSLENGEKSPIIRIDDKYYIYEMVNSYNEEETKENKYILKKERSKAELEKKYDEFIKIHTVNIQSDIWDRVLNCFDKNLTVKDFFSTYKENIDNASL